MLKPINFLPNQKQINFKNNKNCNFRTIQTYCDTFERTEKSENMQIHSIKINNAKGKAVEIQVIKGDITKLNVDSIVNAANSTLLGGGGVDGAIHRAAGKELLEECRTLNGCKTGEAKITKGHNLPAKFVIHTVGPDCRIQKIGVEEALASCYQNSLELADKNNVKSVAFPAISCGVYAFPLDKACKIAVNEVKDYIQNSADKIEKVIFVAFDDKTANEYIKNF